MIDLILIYLGLSFLFYLLFCAGFAKYGYKHVKNDEDNKQVLYIFIILLLSLLWPFVTIYSIGFYIFETFKPKQES